MNEFEWRQQLRTLRQPRHPSTDLWTRIDHALDARARDTGASPQPLARPPYAWRHLWAAGLAASVLILAGGVGWHRAHSSASAPLAATGGSHWKPADPRLAGAAIELDAARMELQLAIQQSPQSAALQRLLSRTELQQNQLRQLAGRAG